MRFFAQSEQTGFSSEIYKPGRNALIVAKSILAIDIPTTIPI